MSTTRTKANKPIAKSMKQKCSRNDLGVSTGEAVRAILENPATYELADAIVESDPTLGGAPRKYPKYLIIVAMCLADIKTSARSAFTEMHDDMLWNYMRSNVERIFPEDASMHLPAKAPSRSWYVKTMKRHGVASLAELQEKLTKTAIEAAVEQGLDIATPGQPIEVDLDRMIARDGKVITPITKYKKGDMRDVEVVDTETGEILIQQVQRRHEPDAKSYIIGTGEQVIGVKTMNISVAGNQEHRRAILAVDHVPGERGERNSEADVLMKHIRMLKEKAPGIVGPITDGVLHGTHLHVLQRELGMLPIAPVTAAKVNKKTGEREEKEGLLPGRIITFEGCAERSLEIHYYAGGLYKKVEYEEGSELEPLMWKRPVFKKNTDGTYRTYVEYQAECNCGQGHKKTFTERTFNNEEDLKQGTKGKAFNRAENVRLVPPGFEVFEENYGQREEAVRQPSYRRSPLSTPCSQLHERATALGSRCLRPRGELHWTSPLGSERDTAPQVGRQSTSHRSACRLSNSDSA